MPFVTIVQITSLLPSSVVEHLNEDDNFTVIERQAAQIISDITGFAIPELVTSAPAWVTTPAAWIIIKLCNPTISNASREYLEEVETNFKRALAMLEQHKTKPATNNNSLTGVYPIPEKTW